jgi:hypothetical protein
MYCYYVCDYADERESLPSKLRVDSFLIKRLKTLDVIYKIAVDDKTKACVQCTTLVPIQCGLTVPLSPACFCDFTFHFQ